MTRHRRAKIALKGTTALITLTMALGWAASQSPAYASPTGSSCTISGAGPCANSSCVYACGVSIGSPTTCGGTTGSPQSCSTPTCGSFGSCPTTACGGTTQNTKSGGICVPPPTCGPNVTIGVITPGPHSMCTETPETLKITPQGGVIGDTIGVINSANNEATSITNSGVVVGDNSGIKLDTGSTISYITNDPDAILDTQAIASAIEFDLTTPGGLILGGVYGINVGASGAATITGSINNSGTIQGGQFSNSEEIGCVGDVVGFCNFAVSALDSQAPVAYGIHMGSNATISGSINNSGTIQGVQREQNITGNALLGVTANEISTANAYGVYLGKSATIAGGIHNSGTIQGGNFAGITELNLIQPEGRLTISGTQPVNGYGVYVSDHASVGFISNSGSIFGSAGGAFELVTGDAGLQGGLGVQGLTAPAYGYGIYVGESASIGYINNSGLIYGSSQGADISSIYGSSQGADISSSFIYLGSRGAGISFGESSNLIMEIEDLGIGPTDIGFSDSVLLAPGDITNSFEIKGGAGISFESANHVGSINNIGPAALISGSAGAGIFLGQNGTIQSISNSGNIISNIDFLEVDSVKASAGVLATGDSIAAFDGFFTSLPAGVLALDSSIGEIDNSGVISGFVGIGFISSGGNGAITNEESGKITGLAGVLGFYGSAIESINNSGLISGLSAAVYLIGASSVGAISNHGSIIGGSSGAISAAVTSSGSGIRIESSSFITGGVVNSTGGRIFGESVGIIVAGSSDITGGITNAGTISGGSHGISVINFSSVTGGITNTGRILGLNGAAIYLDPSDIPGGITNSATISGSKAIFVDTGAVSGGITQNSGLIFGSSGIAIQLDNLTASTPININGGIINGDVIDSQYQNGLSPLAVNSSFMTMGDFQVSNLQVSGKATTLTISSTDNITVNTMTPGTGTINFVVIDKNTFGTLNVTGGAVDVTGGVSATLPAVGVLPAGSLRLAEGAAPVNGTGTLSVHLPDPTPSFVWDYFIKDGSFVGQSNTDVYLVTQVAMPTFTPATGSVATLDTLLGLQGTTDEFLAAIIEDLNTLTSLEDLNDLIASIQPPTENGAEFIAHYNAVSASQETVQQQVAELRTGGEPTGMSAGNRTSTDLLGLRFWSQAFGESAEQDRRDNVSGYEVDTFGVAFGVDTGNSLNRAVAGLAFSYAGTDIESSNVNKTSTEIDSYQLSLYGDFDLDTHTFVEGMLGYAWNNNESRRRNVGLLGLTAKGEYDSSQYSARLALGHDYTQGVMTLTPRVFGNYQNIQIDSYTETGAGGANLFVKNDNLSIFEIGVSAEASWKLSLYDGEYFKPAFSFGYSYDTIGDNAQSTSRFTGGGASFQTSGFDPARHKIDLGAAIGFHSDNGFEFTVSYDYTYKADYDAHAGFVRLGYQF